MTATRRLAAILEADVAGYSRLIEADEEGTLGRFKVLRAEASFLSFLTQLHPTPAAPAKLFQPIASRILESG
jgi:hypothetical protein